MIWEQALTHMKKARLPCKLEGLFTLHLYYLPNEIENEENLIVIFIKIHTIEGSILGSFRHFGLSWAFVDPKTPIENGVKFCACVKEFIPWLRMPLQALSEDTYGCVHFLSSFCMCNIFIWYEILFFSKLAHPLSYVIGYPYVFLRGRLIVANWVRAD
uniref:Uncharacterized protein n=1 Tax=Lactuca sativa TaxID=4236 RepID=A0A9R1XMA4_LACSA|nr:hypothetical protein LSAT_V11C200077410 [Lactuca sativa]